jgi:CheY-like chemotaxis protein
MSDIKNILIVEDDEDFIQLLSKKFDIQGYTYDICSNIPEALNKLCQIQYRAISLDIMIEDGNCAEIIKFLRDSQEHINSNSGIFVLSSHVNDQFKKRMMKKSIKAFSKKSDLDKYFEDIFTAGAEDVKDEMSSVLDSVPQEDMDELIGILKDIE